MSLLLQRSIVRGCKILLRDRTWFHSFGALLGVFLIVQILAATLFGLLGIQSHLIQQADFQITMRETATDTEIQTFVNSLKDQSFVQSTTYRTKEQLYERARKSDPELTAFLDEKGIENPFSDTLMVSLTDFGHIDILSAFMQQEQWSTTVDSEVLSDMSHQKKSTRELLIGLQTGRSLVLLVLIVIAVTLILITAELIRHRIAMRRDEVQVETIAGAPYAAVFIPFVTEISLLFIGAALMSIILVTGILSLVPSIIPEIRVSGFAPLVEYFALKGYSAALVFFVIEAVLSPFIVAAGVWLGIRNT